MPLPMRKVSRQAAVAAELARRERQSGVPREKHVYLLHPHHTDEGGPQPFAPAEAVENLRAANQDASLYDASLFRRLTERATSGGQPIDLIPDPMERWSRDLSPADFCTFGINEDELMIFSSRAATALWQSLNSSCQTVPIRCSGHELFGFRLSAAQDVLDTQRSDAHWLDPAARTQASHIESYTLFTDRLGDASIFRVTQNFRILVLQRVVDVVRANDFSGFHFRKIWPRPPLETWA